MTIDQTSLAKQAEKSLRKSTKTGLFTSDRKREAARVDYNRYFDQLSVMIENETKTALDVFLLQTRNRLEDVYKEVVRATDESLRRIRQRKKYLVKLSMRQFW